MGYAGGMASLFGGKTNSEVSKEYRSIVTPAGWAFSIWSVIFVGELIFTIWQTCPGQRDSPILKKLGYWWVATNVLQSAWTFAFAYENMWLAAVILSGICVCLGVMYFALHRSDDCAQGIDKDSGYTALAM